MIWEGILNAHMAHLRYIFMIWRSVKIQEHHLMNRGFCPLFQSAPLPGSKLTKRWRASAV